MEKRQELQNISSTLEEGTTDNRQELRNIQEIRRENLRIRKTAWIQEQMQRQREAEDALFLQIKQEQEVLDALRTSIQENMDDTKEARKYNQEFQDSIDAQVFALYGISSDKLQGMQEYKNAYYRGCAFSLFFLSLVLTVLCGILHGFQSQICLFLLSFSAVEGVLLSQEKKRWLLLDVCEKGLYLLMFPIMMAVFVCYELGYPEYGIFLPALVIFGMIVLAAGMAAYFLYNPYREDKRAAQEAKDAIRGMEKTARREIKKNRRIREKTEKKQSKKNRRDRKKEEKRQKRKDKRQKRIEEKKERREKRRAPGAGNKRGLFTRFRKAQPVREISAQQKIEENVRAVQEPGEEEEQSSLQKPEEEEEQSSLQKPEEEEEQSSLQKPGEEEEQSSLQEPEQKEEAEE